MLTGEEEIIVASTDSIPGKRIVKVLGAVRAGASFYAWNGPKSAQNNLVKEAKKLGANAIVGFRMQGWAPGPIGKAYAYGTAVLVEDKKIKKRKGKGLGEDLQPSHFVNLFQ